MAETGLVQFDAALAAIQKAVTVDEVKSIRNKAEACKAYAAQVGASMQALNDIAEIKVRAERRAGELLAESNGLGKKGGNRKSSNNVLLHDIGVTKIQSSRWQQAASVPPEQFEGYLEQCKHKGTLITSSGVLKIAKAITHEESAVMGPPKEKPFNERTECDRLCDRLRDLHGRVVYLNTEHPRNTHHRKSENNGALADLCMSLLAHAVISQDAKGNRYLPFIRDYDGFVDAVSALLDGATL